MTLEGLLGTIVRDTGIQTFSLTTNGTISREFDYWERLARAGLSRVNISISDLLEYSECADCDGRWPYLPAGKTATVFESQVNIIKILNKLGIPVDINVVVFNDSINTWNVLQRLIQLRRQHLIFRIMLLPNILNRRSYEASIRAIQRIIQKCGFRKASSKRLRFSSNGKVLYRYGDIDIFVKSTMLDGETGELLDHPYYLEGLCSGCKFRKSRDCIEGFYGIRLEARREIPMVRLCVHRQVEGYTTMTVEEFLNSQAFEQLKTFRLETE